jgi:predicted ATPase
VGRAEELAGVVAALGSSLVIDGCRRVGKTRLALEAAAGVLDRFVDGVWLVELAPVAEAQVPFVVGAAVGVMQQPAKTMLSRWPLRWRLERVVGVGQL